MPVIHIISKEGKEITAFSTDEENPDLDLIEKACFPITHCRLEDGTKIEIERLIQIPRRIK